MSEEPLRIRELKPGLLVKEQVTIRGGISYSRNELEDLFENGQRRRKWETESIIENEEEFKLARNLRSSAYKDIRRCCANTPAGLICSVEKEENLQNTISEILQRTRDFNNNSSTCNLLTRYFLYRVEPDNKEVLEAITEQIAEIAERVQVCLEADDLTVLKRAQKGILLGKKPEEIMALEDKQKNMILGRARAQLIKNVIAEAKGIDSLLQGEASNQVRKLVKESRKISKKLIRDIEKRDMSIQEALDAVDSSGIQQIRDAFVLAAAAEDDEFNEEEIYEERLPIAINQNWSIIEPKEIVFSET